MGIQSLTIEGKGTFLYLVDHSLENQHWFSKFKTMRQTHMISLVKCCNHHHHE
jgi:hypothetical protein